MKVAVISTVVFEVPDETPVAILRERFRRAHVAAIGIPMQTAADPSQHYILRAIDHLEVVRLP